MVSLICVLAIYSLLILLLSVAFVAFILHSLTPRIIDHTLHTRDYQKRNNGGWGDSWE